MLIKHYSRNHFNSLYDKSCLKSEFKILEGVGFVNKEYEHQIASQIYYLDKMNYRRANADMAQFPMISWTDTLIMEVVLYKKLEPFADSIIFTHNASVCKDYKININMREVGGGIPSADALRSELKHLIIDTLKEEFLKIFNADGKLYINNLIRSSYASADDPMQPTIAIISKIDYDKTSVYDGNFDKFLYEV